MFDKNGKKAVIISNIRSDSIEQAIFILKSNGSESVKDSEIGIVAEAQEIINNYIKRVERAIPYRAKRRNKNGIVIIAAIIALVAVLSGLVLSRF